MNKTALKILEFLDVIVHFFIKKFNILVHKNKQLDIETAHNLPFIDIFILVVEKDLVLLPYCINGIKANSLNPVRNIYIIAPPLESIKKISNELEVEFVDENTITQIPRYELFGKLEQKSIKNPSWIYQQILKLSLADFSNSEYYLIIDADTILIRPQEFVNANGHQVLKYSDELHFMYQITNKRLINTLRYSRRSFICHHQLITRRFAKEMLFTIEKNNNDYWYNSIIETISRENHFFSEYELYGNFLIAHYPNNFTFKYWSNLNITNKSSSQYFKSLINNMEHLSRKYLSISIHNYDGYFY